jgi:hypothetical protein
MANTLKILAWMEVFAKIKRDLLVAFVKVRDNKKFTASIEHLPTAKGNMNKLEEEPTTSCLIEAAFNVQSNSIVAKASTVPHFDVNLLHTTSNIFTDFILFQHCTLLRECDSSDRWKP